MLLLVGLVILLLNCSTPDFENPCINNLGIERCTLKASTALENTFINVGIKRAPVIVANVVENNIHLNIYNNSLELPIFILFSIFLANSGACIVFAVLDIKANTLNTAKDIAILPVLTPTILTEYANVDITNIIKVSKSTTIICVDIFPSNKKHKFLNMFSQVKIIILIISYILILNLKLKMIVYNAHIIIHTKLNFTYKN